jgi:hypothetical protein
MPVELDVLKVVSERLEAAGLPFMLTGSFAMAFYGQPRMTRDIDIVIALGQEDVPSVLAALSEDFYVDADAVLAAVVSQRLFNLMHLPTSLKVDLIVRKGSEYRQVEFARRQRRKLQGLETWIVSREDLILSKLMWAKESGSEVQRRDVGNLLQDSVDHAYLDHWAKRLGLAEALAGVAE